MTTTGTFFGTLRDEFGNELVAGATGIQLVPAVVVPPIDPPVVQPAHTLAVYLMMWSASHSPRLAALPAQFNEVRLAFAQGDPPSMVGWASQSPVEFLADVKLLEARGVRFLVSVGGQGGALNPANRDAFVAGISRIHSIIGLDGLDWDLEASSLNGSDVVAISQTLYDQFGWLASFAPNGGNVDRYLPAAVACNQRGILGTYGQQFYDSAVPLGSPDTTNTGTAFGRVNEAIKAGIPSSKLTIGCMVASDAKHWTVDQCVNNIAAIKGKYNALAGAYLWEAGRKGPSGRDVTDWAAKVGALFT